MVIEGGVQAGAANIMSNWGLGDNEAKEQCFPLPFQLEFHPPTQPFQVLWGKERPHVAEVIRNQSSDTVSNPLVVAATLDFGPISSLMHSPGLPK